MLVARLPHNLRIAVTCAFVSVLSTFFVDRAAHAQKVGIEKAGFAKAITEDDQLMSPGSTFEPTDSVILKVSLDSRPRRGKLSCTFYLATQKITTVSADLAKLNAQGAAANINAYGVFTLKPTEPFPVSDEYRAVIAFEDQKLGTYPFEIVAAAEPAPSGPPVKRNSFPMKSRSGGQPNDAPKDAREIVQILLKSTAYIECEDDLGNAWTGTGWILDKERKLIITNDHVANAGAHGDGIGAVTSMKMYFPEFKDGRVVHDKSYYEQFATPVGVSVIYGDKERDLALFESGLAAAKHRGVDAVRTVTRAW